MRMIRYMGCVSVLLLTFFATEPISMVQAQTLQQAFKNSSTGINKFGTVGMSRGTGIGMPRSIGVGIKARTNENSGFSVMVDVDRKDRIYREGDTIKISVKSSRDGYVYLVNFASNGSKTLLIPNQYFQENRIKAGQTLTYPAPDSPYELPVMAPFGEDVIKVFVTQQPLKSISKNMSEFSKSVASQLDESTLEEMDQELDSWSKAIVPVARPDSQCDFATHSIKIQTCSTSTADETREVAKKPRRMVVCFGVQKYKDSGIRPLSASVNDANAFADFWVRYGSVAKEDCIVLTNEQVTLETVRNVFCEVLPSIVTPGDEIIVYWSGHGAHISATRGSSGTSISSYYLVTYDGDRNDPEHTMLHEDPFGQWVQNLSECRLFFVLDACYSGDIANNAKGLNEDLQRGEDSAPFRFAFSGFSRAKSLGQDGLAVLCSSNSQQLSFERSEGDLSVMTACLLDVMQQPSVVTHKDLKNEVSAEVNEYIRENYPNTKQCVVEQDELSPGLVLKPL